jgi:hypothetical protein
LHLNGRGKEKVAKQIVEKFSSILGKKVEGSISLMWKSDLIKGNRENEINQMDAVDSDATFRRTSNRQKKAPVTRENYFLW